MAGITITGGQPPRIARVDTGSERPTWIGDAAKLDEQKKNLNGINSQCSSPANRACQDIANAGGSIIQRVTCPSDWVAAAIPPE